MTTRDDEPVNDNSREARQAKFKELARVRRREAYERQKAANKAHRLASAKSPANEARKERLKEQRRAAYLKAKQSRGSKADAEKSQAKELSREARRQRDKELMSSLIAGTELQPSDEGTVKRHLRLVKNDE